MILALGLTNLNARGPAFEPRFGPSLFFFFLFTFSSFFGGVYYLPPLLYSRK